MNSYALVAALGMDAVAAVRGYRLQVISEAQRRGRGLQAARWRRARRRAGGDPPATELHAPARLRTGG